MSKRLEFPILSHRIASVRAQSTIYPLSTCPPPLPPSLSYRPTANETALAHKDSI